MRAQDADATAVEPCCDREGALAGSQGFIQLSKHRVHVGNKRERSRASMIIIQPLGESLRTRAPSHGGQPS
jgi:hypothetical protein